MTLLSIDAPLAGLRPPAFVALPRTLRIGGGAVLQAAEVLRGAGLSRPFVVTDRFMQASGPLDTLLGVLAEAGMQPRVFADTVPEPTVGCVEAALAALKEGEHDGVVALGGGSPIDTAKAVAVLAVHGGPIQRYKAPFVQDAPGLPIVAIPTTAGTGSEATRFTVITDEAVDEKMLCAGLAYLPVAALVDYELTLTKPRRLTADTGVDALTHAIEAYVSRRANPFSDTFALRAMALIAANLRRVWDDGADREAREAMMLGATLAGIAFSNSSVALVHGMSRPIGAHFHVAHGLSNAMLLPLVTRWSVGGAFGRYATCARTIGAAGPDEGDQAAAARLVERLGQLNGELEVPSPRDYGLDAGRWEALAPLMAEQALASGSPANNPVTPTRDELVELYAQAWHG